MSLQTTTQNKKKTMILRNRSCTQSVYISWSKLHPLTIPYPTKNMEVYGEKLNIYLKQNPIYDLNEKTGKNRANQDNISSVLSIPSSLLSPILSSVLHGYLLLQLRVSNNSTSKKESNLLFTFVIFGNGVL